MRDIKFRGVNHETGEFVYGQLIKTSNPYKTESHGFTDCHIVEDHEEVCTNFHFSKGRRTLDVKALAVKPETVGESTGIKDKNGVEIYEGDVVKVTCLDDVSIHKVTSPAVDYPAFDLEPSWSDEMNSFAHIYYYSDETVEMEVIGNVHQNKELLEEK